MAYAHWFSPVRGANGLKLDAFMDLDFSDPALLKPITTGQFNGSKLFYNETVRRRGRGDRGGDGVDGCGGRGGVWVGR